MTHLSGTRLPYVSDTFQIFFTKLTLTKINDYNYLITTPGCNVATSNNFRAVNS